MKVLKKTRNLLVLIWRMNIIKTLYFNFKMLPFHKAIRMPFFLFGKIYFGDLRGQLIIPDKVSYGMIKVGFKWFDLWPISFVPTQIQIMGKMEFKGKCIISGGANVNVQSKEGVLTIGDCTLIGGGSIVKCLKKITIGDGTRITGNCNIMDCNMHFVKNIDTGVVANYKGTIKIGESCWINYGTIVTKGAVIPDYSITARGTFVSKDFSESGTNLFLVGAPAKVTSSRVQRILTLEKQSEFVDYFEKHNSDILQLEPGVEIENGHREGF